MKRLSKDEHERGAILITMIIIMPFLIAMAVYYTKLSLTSFQVARFDQLHTMAQLAADAGADYAVEQFDADNSWTGTSGEMTVHSDSKVKTTFTSSISGNSSAKTIAVTGRSYFPANSAKANRSVSIDVDLRPVEEGNYSIVTGAGGLVMKNNARITTGNIFINGSLTMSNSSQIGLSVLGIGLLPVPVQVADQICPVPADATYPQVCSGTSHQPITMSNSAEIYGNVTATNQTNTSGITTLHPGTVAPEALPTYDRAAQKAAVAHTMTGAAASCNSQLLGGSVTIPANTEIVGDVTLSGGLFPCTMTVQGNVWITGSLTLKNNSTIVPSLSVGSTMPVVMVDGSSGVSFNNASSSGVNLSLTGIEFITFYCGVGCNEDNPVTGAALAASQTIPTISMNNGSTALNSIFYAYWSQINLANSGQVGAVVGQNIVLSNTASISLGGSASASTTTWVVKGYRRQ